MGNVLVRDTVLRVRAQLLGHRQEVVEGGQVGEVAWGERGAQAQNQLLPNMARVAWGEHRLKTSSFLIWLE